MKSYRMPKNRRVACLRMLAMLLVLASATTSLAVDVTFTVSANSDDADERVSDGNMWVGDGYSYLDNHVGERFQNVTIPNGATITSATLELFSYGSGTTSFSVDIAAQDADTTSTFITTNYDISSRAKTTALTSWVTGSTTYSNNQSFTSPNFATSIQEVVSRPGWSSGNSLVVILTPVSGSKGFWKRSGSSSHAPRLHITYSTEPKGTILFVRAGSSNTTEEQARVTQFESWGYTVTSIEDGAAESSFVTGVASADVVYVPQSADATSLAYKLRTATIGIVHEGVNSWDDNMGWTTSTGQNTNTCTTMTVTDNSHPITSHFSTGTETIFNSSTASYGSQVVATVASGADILATNLCVNSGNANLLVLEKGAALANTYDSNDTASGRRVRLPYGGGYTFAWSNLSSDGLTMIQNALAWASSDGLVAHWKLDDASGTTAGDSSGSGHDATLVGSQGWTTGMDGGGHEFDYSDGTDDYFEAPSSPALDNAHESNYTVMAYFKPNSVPPGSGSNNNASYGILIKEGNHIGLHYNSSQQFQIDHLNAGGSWNGAGTYSNTYPPGVFYHVAGVVNYQAGTIDIYVDGVLAGSDTFTPGSSPQDYGSARWRLGVALPGSGSWRWPADGVIDDARIYNRALTAEELSQYASSGLVGHWKLDETSGSDATDTSTVGNDGALTNGGTWSSGVRGGAITFDGSNDYVEVPHNDAYLADNGTLAFWFKADDLVGSQGLFSKDSSGYDTGGHITVRLDGDTLEVRLQSSSANYVLQSPGLVAGRWNFVALQWGSDGYRLLLDGVEVDSDSYTGGLGATSGGTGNYEPIVVGANAWSSGDLVTNSLHSYFSGQIDDLRVYALRLTTEEIAELYGLLGHWKLDENSGTAATDSSGIGNDGNYQGGSAPGASGPFPGNGANAAEFAGSSGDKIALPTMDYDFSDGLTMAVWYNASTLTGSYTDFFSLSNGSLVDDIWFGLDNAQGLDLFLSDTADGASFRGLIETTTIATNKWQHAVAVIDSAGNGTLYRNGKVVASGYVGLPGNVARTQNGIGETTFGHTIDGELFDARIYNRPLSAGEIAEIYGLVAHWKLNEATGTTAADATGSGYDGTHTGGVTVNASGPYPGDGAVAAEFDGSDDHVDLPSMALDFSGGFSAACWVKPSTTLGSGEFNAFLDLSNGSDVDEIWVGGVGVSGFQLYLTDTDDGSSLRTIEDNTDLEAGKWTHYVATVDSSGNAKLYRNGVLTKSQYTSFPTSVSRTQATLAKSPLNDNYPGSLHDVRVYNRPLSDQEITELYGLVGHWAFDEGAGSTIADSTLNSNSASFNTGTPAWVDGVYGSALEFDGTNDAATDVNFDPPENGAVSMWLRSDGPPASRMRPWGVGADYEMWQDTDGLVSMDVNTDGYQGGFITTEPLYRPSVWYHIVAQYNSDDESYEIYINGDLHKSGISTRDIQKQTANLLSFGTRTGSTQRYSGAIDDFRIYNRWLSVADINHLYGRVAYWKLDETSGSVAVDSTAHGNDGTLVSGPDWTTAGSIDGALDFESSNAERIDAGTFDVGGSAMTLMGWVKAEGGVHDGRIVFKSSSNTGTDHAWGLTVADSLKPEFRLTAGGTLERLITPGVVSTGRWYHLAGTYDGTTMRLYINGLEADTLTHPVGGAIDQDSSKYVTLGDSPIGGRAFDGMIDDVQVFDRALDPSEVFNAYKGGRPAGVRILQWVETR